MAVHCSPGAVRTVFFGALLALFTVVASTLPRAINKPFAPRLAPSAVVDMQSAAGGGGVEDAESETEECGSVRGQKKKEASVTWTRLA